MGVANRISTKDLIKQVIDSLVFTFSIDSVVDNLDGTWTLITNNTYHLRQFRRVSIDGGLWLITDFEKHTSITVKPLENQASFPNVITFEIGMPYYFHGKTRMTDSERQMISDSWDKVPFVWLYETYRERYIEDPTSQIRRESEIRLFFLDETNFQDFLNEEHHVEVLEPMKELVSEFFVKIDQSANFGKYTDYDLIPWVNFGRFQGDNGVVSSIFSEDLSGYEVRVTLPILVDDCTDSKSPICRPVTILDTTGDTEIIPSGGSFICTQEEPKEGVYYHNPNGNGILTIVSNYDEAWLRANGMYDRNNPSNPLIVAGLDYSNSNYHFNVDYIHEFGHSKRLTSLEGNYYDEQTGQYKDKDGTVIAGGKNAAFPDKYAIDHYANIGVYLENLTSNLNWADALEAAYNFSGAGFSDYRAINRKEADTIVSLISPFFTTPNILSRTSGSINQFWTSTPSVIIAARAYYYTDVGDFLRGNTALGVSSRGVYAVRTHYT